MPSKTARLRSAFGAWFDDLDATAAAKVTTALARITQGNLSNVKGVGAGLLEYRIDFTFLGPLVYLNDTSLYTVPLALSAFVDSAGQSAWVNSSRCPYSRCCPSSWFSCSSRARI